MRSGFPSIVECCQDFSAPKYAYKVNLDGVGTADILEVKNATLRGSERDMLLRALSSRVSNDQLRIADKYNDIYVPHPNNSCTFTVSQYQHEPNKQVVDLSSCLDLSRDEDYNEALDSLTHRPRLAVFKSMAVSCSR